MSKELYDLGADRCILCGSGPTVCGIFTDRERAEKASEVIPYKTFVCKITGITSQSKISLQTAIDT